jgi:integrase/recombinase XerD
MSVPHFLSHTSATNYLVHGGDLISLQRKLRQSSLTMTDRYIHLASDQAAIIQERAAPMVRLDVKPMRVPKGR